MFKKFNKSRKISRKVSRKVSRKYNKNKNKYKIFNGGYANKIYTLVNEIVVYCDKTFTLLDGNQRNNLFLFLEITPINDMTVKIEIPYNNNINISEIIENALKTSIQDTNDTLDNHISKYTFKYELKQKK